MLQPVDMLLLQEMTVNDGGFLNAVRDGSCTHVLNLLHGGGVDLEQRDEVRNVGNEQGKKLTNKQGNQQKQGLESCC